MVTDRNGLRVLSVEDCMRLLETHVPRVGRVSVMDGGRPLILPVNYIWTDGTVVFRTDPGAKLNAAAGNDLVAFEIDDIDPTWHEGWSVVVIGTAEEVMDADEIHRLQELPLRPWAGSSAAYVRISPKEISGRSLV